VSQELRDVWGKTVTLTVERLAHLREHPEMREQEDKLAETLREPDMVIQSQSDDSVRLFYRLYTGLAIGDKFLCVVVKYTRAHAFIITGYFTDKVKQGEVLWKK
jgi:hypothetical protein